MKNTLLLIVVTTLMSCSAYNINYERKPGTDFSKYHSYAWLPPDSTSGKYVNKKYVNDRIMFYTNRQLAQKGMHIDAQKPDALFNFYTYTVDKVEYQYNPPPAAVSFGFGGPGYYMGYAAPLAPATVTPVTYREGTLVIEMYDVATQSLVWKGVVTKALDRSVDIDAELNAAISRTMFTLPVKPSRK
jgi:hypothetical protein